MRLILLWFFFSALAYSHNESRSHFILGIGRNNAVFGTANSMGMGKFHPSIGFRIVHEESFYLGVRGEFMFYSVKSTQEEFPIFALSQESLYKIDLYTDTSIGFGGTLLYLLPTRRAMFPLRRNEDYPADIGVGLCGLLSHDINDFQTVYFRAVRWRGTKTMKLHGVAIQFETSLRL